MNYYELIQQRSSVRNYNPNKTIDKELLLKILEAGRLAPSACNKQPWTFVVINSKEVLNKVHLAYERDWLSQAPTIIAVKGKRTNAWERKYDGYNSLETDLTIVMDHIIMAATEEGLGTCWIAAFNPAILHQALHLKTDEVIYAITPLGYPHEEPLSTSSKTRKGLDEMVEWL